MQIDAQSPRPVYSLHRPDAQTSASVFSSPHSGDFYPSELLERTDLDDLALRSSEDAFVNQLFRAAPSYGAPLLAASYPRAFVDLNRASSELDPALIAGAPKSNRSPRINAGLGVIPRVVSESRAIQSGKMTLSDAQGRIDTYYTPYHETLHGLLRETRDRFGYAILFDCHSMPHDALAGSTMVNGARPEIVLGDRFGASCERWVMDAATELFLAAGFRVVRNAPFAGGFITQSYGKPSAGIHALQIEIDRSLYMDEATITKSAKFSTVQRQIGDIVRQLATIGEGSARIAAE